MNTHCSLKPVLFFVFVLSLVLLPGKLYAAAPDGAGPWADTVVSTAQGLRKDGSAVPLARSDASSSLGVAENDTADGHFYSLGFGGTIVLKFDNTQSGGVVVVEATNPGYPNEKATVEVSENGTTWVSAGTVTTDGEVNVPQNVCVQYVRIKDTSSANDFSDLTADGYDVDGVKLSGTTCKPKHNGGGDTTIIIDQTTKCSVTQSSETNVVNVQGSTATTGNNTIKKSTGGSNTIKTGKAKSKNKAIVTGGSNIAVNPCGCCSPGDVNVTVGGNGSSSSQTNTTPCTN